MRFPVAALALAVIVGAANVAARVRKIAGGDPQIIEILGKPHDTAELLEAVRTAVARGQIGRASCRERG